MISNMWGETSFFSWFFYEQTLQVRLLCVFFFFFPHIWWLLVCRSVRIKWLSFMILVLLRYLMIPGVYICKSKSRLNAICSCNICQESLAFVQHRKVQVREAMYDPGKCIAARKWEVMLAPSIPTPIHFHLINLCTCE